MECPIKEAAPTWRRASPSSSTCFSLGALAWKNVEMSTVGIIPSLTIQWMGGVRFLLIDYVYKVNGLDKGTLPSFNQKPMEPWTIEHFLKAVFTPGNPWRIGLSHAMSLLNYKGITDFGKESTKNAAVGSFSIGHFWRNKFFLPWKLIEWQQIDKISALSMFALSGS